MGPRGLKSVRIIAALALAAMASVSSAYDHVPKPTVVIDRPGQCVADKDTMRREHMNLLRHQRDKTMREGIRTKQFSLNACIDCHASRKTGSVIGSNENFCQSCHSYAAVKLDCFECHNGRPGGNVAGASARPPALGPKPELPTPLSAR